jgi:hypothetical protein
MFVTEFKPDIPETLYMDINIPSKKRKTENLIDEDYILNSFNSSMNRENYNYDYHIEVFMDMRSRPNLCLEEDEDILSYLKI